MKAMYAIAGVTRQALHKRQQKQAGKYLVESSILEAVIQVRKEHPKMGCRSLYEIIKPANLGRDRFEQLLLKKGYRVKYKRKFTRTTYSTSRYHPNLIKGLELTDINQLWQSDITYFYANGRFYYITFIIDVYSRRIVGFAASKTLHAEANIEALKMALKARKGCDLKKLVHHSDRGGQYVDKEYEKLLDHNDIAKSMCKSAWENPYAERINGVIKNMYLEGWVINNFEQLQKQLGRAVYNYNTEKPHGNLPKKLTPVNFEKMLLNCSATTKPRVRLYTEAKMKSEADVESAPLLPQLQPRDETLPKAIISS